MGLKGYPLKNYFFHITSGKKMVSELIPLQLAELGATMTIIVLIALVFIIGLVLGTIFLQLALNIVGVPEEERDFNQVFITQVLNTFIGSFCCIISWYFIKSRHDIGWGKAIVAWILSLLIPGLIAFGIYLAIGGGMAFFGM